MRLSTHISFSGQCEEAFLEYQRILGGTTALLRYGDSPMAGTVDKQWHDRIVHGTLQVGEFELAGSDQMGKEFQKPQGFAVILQVHTVEKAQQIYDALSVGGVIGMPLQATFWSPGYAMFVDRFGVPWEINCG
jgi:PhnB protein